MGGAYQLAFAISGSMCLLAALLALAIGRRKLARGPMVAAAEG